VAITRPKLGSSTKPESTHPRNLRSNNKAFNLELKRKNDQAQQILQEL
jgi:hypothetical protein